VVTVINSPSVCSALQPDDRLRVFTALLLLTDRKEVEPTITILAYKLWAEFLAASPAQLKLQHYRLSVNYLLMRISDPDDEKALLPMAIIDLVKAFLTIFLY
jgi:hypothetical protein